MFCRWLNLHHPFNTATHVTLLIEITLLIIFTGQHETAVLSEVKVIHKQKGPITFMTPNANFTTFALEHGTKPQTISELPGGGSRVTPRPHSAQHPGNFGTRDSVSKKKTKKNQKKSRFGISKKLSSRKFIGIFFSLLFSSLLSYFIFLDRCTPYSRLSLISCDRRGLQSLPDNVRRVFESSPQLEAS